MTVLLFLVRKYVSNDGGEVAAAPDTGAFNILPETTASRTRAIHAASHGLLLLGVPVPMHAYVWASDKVLRSRYEFKSEKLHRQLVIDGQQQSQTHPARATEKMLVKRADKISVYTLLGYLLGARTLRPAGNLICWCYDKMHTSSKKVCVTFCGHCN